MISIPVNLSTECVLCGVPSARRLLRTLPSLASYGSVFGSEGMKSFGVKDSRGLDGYDADKSLPCS